jgi:hypothetical protein
LLLSALLGVIACGICFYLILFVCLAFELLVRPLNPANAPELVYRLRYYAVPISVVLGSVIFCVTFTGSGKRHLRRGYGLSDRS